MSTKFLIRILFIISLIPFLSFGQEKNSSVKLPPFKSPQAVWVDSIYHSLTLEKKIAQLYMVAAYSGGEKFNQPLIEKLIADYGIGGLIYMQGTPKAQAEQTNLHQSKSKVPLLIAMDAEWGLGMRLTGIKDFPRQIMLGAMQDSSIVFKMAAAIANQCRRLGVHINFAPVIDVNNNPNNPVINFRSFGENKNKVANFGIQYMRGLQNNGVMACAKHFPGHGDTDVDSHKDTPEITKSLSDLEKLELYPFTKLIANGIQSIMVAHLQIPALDSQAHTPSTLSEKTVTDLLKKKMGFMGLIFTDALNMEGVAKHFSPGDIDLKAFQAGNDVLLFSQDVPTGIQKIKNAIETKVISESRLEESVKKILVAKYNADLYHFKKINIENIDEDINQYTSTIRLLVAENAITLLNDPNLILEKIKKDAVKDIVYVGIGTSSETKFTNELKKYGIKEILFAPTSERELKTFVKELKDAEAVIVGVHNMSGYPKNNFGLDELEVKAVNLLSQNNNAMTVLFGNPYAVKSFCDIEGLLVTYDEAEETQNIAAKMITSQLKAKGKLPVTVCENYKEGDGIVSLKNALGEVIDSARFAKQNKDVPEKRFKTSSIFSKEYPLECCVSPLALGINIAELDKLDAYLEGCVNRNIFPGCRILAAKAGNVFYDKSFGFIGNDKRNAVDINTIYDVASVTKVAATTMAVMKLYDEGKLDLNATLGKYVEITRGTDKENLRIKDILTHQAGLKSWIPFYKETLDSSKYPNPLIYNKTIRGKYTLKVADNLYIRTDWVDTMWQRILASPLENSGKYVYSDLDFIFMQAVVENIAKKKLDEFVRAEFYKPLGMNYTCYSPKKNLKNAEIAPSEFDDYFRHQMIQGNVHDMGAAMFGGVSGHAGLFSTANDLGILMQMLLNGGSYQGKRYFQKSTVELFTAKYSMISRRGLGFDKPEPNADKSSPCADNASLKAFGHQGFTGTCIWADPSNDLVFVFLSNRTYPTAENKAINKNGGVREIAQSYIYKSLGIPSRYTKWK
jgi:beta-glucosidase-like glycosyl hydrolase/CubicO group peptidase (beta-lactamase class C family)